MNTIFMTRPRDVANNHGFTWDEHKALFPKGVTLGNSGHYASDTMAYRKVHPDLMHLVNCQWEESVYKVVKWAEQVERWKDHGLEPIVYNSYYLDEPRTPEKVVKCQAFIDRHGDWGASFMVAGGFDVVDVKLSIHGQKYQALDLHLLELIRAQAQWVGKTVREYIGMLDDMVLGGYLAVDETQPDKYQPGWFWKEAVMRGCIHPPTFNTGPGAIGWYLREVGAEFFLYFITLGDKGEDKVLWDADKRLWTPAMNAYVEGGKNA